MTGYHYTDARLIPEIKKHGLVPQRLKRHEKDIQDALHMSQPILGIWVWEVPLELYCHWATVLWQCWDKRTDKIAVLKVQYERANILGLGDRLLWLDHNYDFDGLRIDHSSPGRLLKDKIPPERVKLKSVIDLHGKIRRTD